MRQGTQDFKKAQTTLEFMLGPIKIKDGLFMGDQLAAKDIEFIISNKVTHVINTVSKAVPNLYERFGVQYLSVHWTEKEQNIFDKKNNAVNAIFQFVQEAMEMGQSCLIHSLHGKSRATAVLVAYLMKKYGWSMNKALQLVHSKKQGLEVRQNYLKQVQELEKRLAQGKLLSQGWSDSKEGQDLLLANTFKNSKKMEAMTIGVKKNCKKKLTWDQKLVQKAANTTMSGTMGRFKDQKDPQPKKPVGRVKSILKGCPNPGQDQLDTPLKKQFTIDDNDKVINNINGNIVHVTVNNFITTEKKPEPSTSKLYNSRPYSSDTKDREKKSQPYEVKTSKLFGYDTFSGSGTSGGGMKSAYEQKIMGRNSNSSKGGPRKKQEKGFVANDRPNSANTSEEVKKPKPMPFGSLAGREEMMVTGSSGMGPSSLGKKKYGASSGARSDQKYR